MTSTMMEENDTLKFHHLGLVVPTIISGRTHLESLLGSMVWGASIVDPLQNVSICFGHQPNSDLVYELIEPSIEGSPIDRALKENKNILNHIAYKSTDFKASCQSLRSKGCAPLSRPQPAVAFNGSKIMFFLTPLKFIIEVIES